MTEIDSLLRLSPCGVITSASTRADYICSTPCSHTQGHTQAAALLYSNTLFHSAKHLVLPRSPSSDFPFLPPLLILQHTLRHMSMTRYALPTYSMPPLLGTVQSWAEKGLVHDVICWSQLQNFGIFHKGNDLTAGESDKHTYRAV